MQFIAELADIVIAVLRWERGPHTLPNAARQLIDLFTHP